MINVKFFTENHKLVAFNIKGHAGYAEHGYDIVCSAVSAISTTIVNGITEVLKIEAPYEVKDGFLNLNLRGLAFEDIEKCTILMETMLVGFKSMKVNYGDYIKVIVEEV
jgi:uncharacterized protein YsxB (DUF464 family)